MKRCLGVLAGAVVVPSSVMMSGPAAAGPPCGVNLAAPQVLDAVTQLPPYPGTDWEWSRNPRSFTGNFDPCATLSTTLVSVEGATASSPVTALMFHRGSYVGTATSKAYGFTSLDAAASDDDTVVLRYTTPGSCNACPPAATTNVRYRWQGDHVAMLDPPPPG